MTAFGRYLKNTAEPEFSPAAIAKAIRMSVPELSELFPSLEVLVSAAMARLQMEADQAFFSGGDGRGWRDLENYVALLRDLGRKQGAVSMFVRLRVEASDPEYPAREILDDLRNRSIEALESILRGGVEDAEMLPEIDPARTARALLALIEGSQGQNLAIEGGVDAAENFAEYADLPQLKYSVSA